MNCTFVFDRKAYHPAFFIKLWDQYRIAVITYRKNVKDKWAKEDFEPYTFKQFDKEITVQYCDQKTQTPKHPNTQTPSSADTILERLES